MTKLIVSLIFCSSIFTAAKAAVPDSGDFTVQATDLMVQGSGFHTMDQGRIGVAPDQRHHAAIESVVPAGNGRFDIYLHTVGEPSGQSYFTLKIADRLVGQFTVPVAVETTQVGDRFVAHFRSVEINEGERFTLRAENDTLDGERFSRALWDKLRFVPLDKDPGKESVSYQTIRTQQEIEAGPQLQLPRMDDGNGEVTISGELKQWHPVTLNLSGPFAHEMDLTPNPFLDYRMSVTFSHESGVPSYTVPGYFAADGNAAESSAQSGTLWRAHLSPDKAGRWFYRVSFVRGENAAIEPSVGDYVVPYQGQSGIFVVEPTDKQGRDFRAKGRLEYVGARYLRHAGSGEYFIKAGTDAPETLLAYEDFDNSLGMKPNLPLKTWQPHAKDAKADDLRWQGDKGKNLLGALNYLADKGLNALSFLTYNAAGDGDNVWPYVERNGKLHFDVSKLDQWNMVFTHAQQRGLFLHFKLQENESDDHRHGAAKKPRIIPEALDAGKLGIERKLYLRELVARFGHHLALNWNLGEENTQSYQEQRDMAAYLKELDPYDHLIVIHSFPSQQESVYLQLLGAQSVLTGASLQNHWRSAHRQTLRWVDASEAAGKPWVVANDEQNPAGAGVPPDPGYQGFDGWVKEGDSQYNLHDIRKMTLWGNLMAGGAGVEYYFGYRLPENDLLAEDFRSRDRSWDYAATAIGFFQRHQIPLQRMRNLDARAAVNHPDKIAWAMGAENEMYLVYLPQGGQATLDLSVDSGTFQVQWFDPRNGGVLRQSNVKRVSGGERVSLGKPPENADEDWLILLSR
ncbi:DUF5060 domain-containing protein [Alteromonas aestuariivivens]|uniref:DUF5060 domain-containing protein n=1 Tax=Alteromonas aestuariivivens TaxID=1938339 RepID=A0A3D8MF20_9ALTE|nr:DUF5060 domain-containing protein [Alteromonas aestuariivivens]RDV29352.1 DUF5060 domain-containing protein [Alteromonas aestuariivivens]